MSPQAEDSGGSRRRAPGTGVEREQPPGTGKPPRAHPQPTVDPQKTTVVTGESAALTEVEGSDDGVAGDDVESALAVACRERDEYLDMLRRVQADFENYKKRMLRQQTDQLERASESLVAKLLPALDAFDLTRAHLNDMDEASPEVKALLQASGLVVDALAKEGLERIGDAGAPFDPTMHDAVEHAPATDVGGSGASGDNPDTASSGPVVVDVLRSGYRWKGRVMRPAMVRVEG